MYLFDFKNLKDLDTKEIRRLVIVAFPNFLAVLLSFKMQTAPNMEKKI